MFNEFTLNTKIAPFGVPLYIDLTSLLWLILLSMSNGLLMALPLFVLLMLSIVAHEYAHVWMGIKQETYTSHVTLYMLGGAAFQDSTWDKPPSAEAKIAVAGPIMSMLLAGFGFGLFYLFGEPTGKLGSIIWWFASINSILALFNLLPIFPMDGGRVLRSLLSYKMDRIEATSAATIVTYALSTILGIVSIIYGYIMLTLIMAVIAYMAFKEKQAVEQFRESNQWH